jgi:TP901 family phage tail tape measure protein
MAPSSNLNEIAEIFVSLGISTDGMDDAKKEIKGKMRGISQTMRSAGQSMTTFITAPLAAASAAAVKTAADFDKEFAKIEGLVDAGEDVEALKGSVQDLAGETAQAPQELAQGLFFVESAGFRGEKAVSVLEQSARAAAAGLGQTRDVANAVTSAINAYGKENLSAARATDTLVATVREGKVEASELSSSLGRVIPIAAEMGVEFEQVGASIAALTRVGANSRRAVTSLSAVLRTLLKPTADAKEQLSEVGLSVADLRKKVQEGNIVTVLQRLKTAFDGNTEAMTSVFKNSRALRGVLGIVGKSAEEVRAIMDSMRDTSGATDQAFQTMSRTLSFQLSQAWQELKVVTIEWGRYVGGALLPIIQSLVGFLGSMSDSWQGLSSTMQGVIASSVAVVGAMGPVLWLIGSLIPGIYGLVTAFGYLSGAAATAWAALTGPIGLIIGGIAAVAGSVYLIIDNWSALRGFFADLFGGVGKMLKGFGEGMIKFFGWAFTKAGQKILEAMTWTIEQVRGAMEALGFGVLTEQLDDAAQQMTSWGNEMSQTLHGLKAEGLDAFGKMDEGASEFAGNVAEKTGNALGSVMALVSDTKESVQGFFGGGSFGGGGAGGGWRQGVREVSGGQRGDRSSDSFGGSSEGGGSVGKTVTDAANQATSALEDTRSTLDRVASGFDLLGDKARSFGTSLQQEVSALSNDLLGMEGNIDSLASKLKGVGPRAKRVFGVALAAGRKFSNQVGRGASRLVGQFFEMESGINSVKDAFVAAGGIIKNALKKVIQGLVQAVVRALVLKAIMAAITAGGSSGGNAVSGLVGSSMPGGGLGAPAFAAEGGITKAKPTNVIAGEGGEREAIMPLSKLDSMLASAKMSPSGMGQVNINITGETRREGEVLKTVYDKTTREQNRSPHSQRG